MSLEIPIFPADMMQLLGIKHRNTLRLKIERGEIPEPDVRLNQKSRYWHRSTLVKAGLVREDLESANQPSPAASGGAQA